MWSNLMLVISLITTMFLTGCSSGQTNQADEGFQLISGMVTSGGATSHVDEVPMDSFRQRDEVWVITKIGWEPVGGHEDIGQHMLQWNVTLNGRIILTGTQAVHFDKTPYPVWHRYQARTFAAGHYLVEVVVDGNLIDSHEFDVVPNT